MWLLWLGNPAEQSFSSSHPSPRVIAKTHGRRYAKVTRRFAVPYLNSTTIMELNAVPEHLLVIGGGYIGLEFGQLFRCLGSRVTIAQRGGRQQEQRS